jgi:hypothetical protein
LHLARALVNQGHYSHLMQGPSFGNALDLGPCLPRKVSLAPPTLWSLYKCKIPTTLKEFGRRTIPLRTSWSPYVWVHDKLHLGFTLCEAHRWGTFLKYGAKFSYHVIPKSLVLGIPQPLLGLSLRLTMLATTSRSQLFREKIE